MSRNWLVRPAAALWGFVVFMPVGVNYGAFALLLLALILAGGWRERAQRVRHHALWWPVVAYVVWTLLVLAFGAHYPQTPSNTVHGLRIAATVLMALALSREEAVWALRGFLAMSVAGLAMIALYYSVGFPMTEAFRGLLVLVGNKSISNALLLTIFGATAAVLGLALLTGHRPWRALVAFGFTVAVVAVITLTLLSRTSLLALLLAIGLACVHQWRRQLRALDQPLQPAGGQQMMGIEKGLAIARRRQPGQPRIVSGHASPPRRAGLRCGARAR